MCDEINLSNDQPELTVSTGRVTIHGPLTIMPSAPALASGTLTVYTDERLVDRPKWIEDLIRDPAFIAQIEAAQADIAAGRVFGLEELKSILATETLPSHEDLERWLRDVPGAVIDLLPDGPERKNAIGHVHEAARLAHEIREAAR